MSLGPTHHLDSDAEFETPSERTPSSGGPTEEVRYTMSLLLSSPKSPVNTTVLPSDHLIISMCKFAAEDQTLHSRTTFWSIVRALGTHLGKPANFVNRTRSPDLTSLSEPVYEALVSFLVVLLSRESNMVASEQDLDWVEGAMMLFSSSYRYRHPIDAQTLEALVSVVSGTIIRLRERSQPLTGSIIIGFVESLLRACIQAAPNEASGTSYLLTVFRRIDIRTTSTYASLIHLVTDALVPLAASTKPLPSHLDRDTISWMTKASILLVSDTHPDVYEQRLSSESGIDKLACQIIERADRDVESSVALGFATNFLKYRFQWNVKDHDTDSIVDLDFISKDIYVALMKIVSKAVRVQGAAGAVVRDASILLLADSTHSSLVDIDDSLFTIMCSAAARFGHNPGQAIRFVLKLIGRRVGLVPLEKLDWVLNMKALGRDAYYAVIGLVGDVLWNNTKDEDYLGQATPIWVKDAAILLLSNSSFPLPERAIFCLQRLLDDPNFSDRPGRTLGELLSSDTLDASWQPLASRLISVYNDEDSNERLDLGGAFTIYNTFIISRTSSKAATSDGLPDTLESLADQQAFRNVLADLGKFLYQALCREVDSSYLTNDSKQGFGMLMSFQGIMTGKPEATEILAKFWLNEKLAHHVMSYCAPVYISSRSEDIQDTINHAFKSTKDERSFLRQFCGCC